VGKVKVSCSSDKSRDEKTSLDRRGGEIGGTRDWVRVCGALEEKKV